MSKYLKLMILSFCFLNEIKSEEAKGREFELKAQPLKESDSSSETIDPITDYFNAFQSLANAENWAEIIALGTKALEKAQSENKVAEEAKICAQLTSTSFYQGNYQKALKYANRCHELSKEFSDPTLFIRSLYLRSAVHRALASKYSEEEDQQKSYREAVDIAEEAAQIYKAKNVNNETLKGKIYFNLGAAYADNPKGDLQEAVRCYHMALEAFKNAKATNDLIRTNIRLGKIYFLKNDFDSSQRIIDDVRLKVSSPRVTAHVDYLEAQLKLALEEPEQALKIAQSGLERAKKLGAKEDEKRFLILIDKIDAHKSPKLEIKNPSTIPM